MGSPISGFPAKVVMPALEDIAPSKIQQKIWIRWVGNAFVIIKLLDKENAQTVISDIFNKIQFTVKMVNDKKLPFLHHC